MKLKFTLFVFITIFAFVFNCSKSDETYTVEMKDGVKYVHNHAPAWGDNPEVSIELIRTFGIEESEDENLMFYKPTDVAEDAAGNVYVLDAGNYRIQKFDAEGKFLASFGREGWGPGEFSMPISIDLDKQGNIYVADMRNRLLQVFKPDGKIHSSTRLEEAIGVTRVLDTGNLHVNTLEGGGVQWDGDEVKIENIRLINIFNNSGKHIRNFGAIEELGDKFTSMLAHNFYSSIDKHGNTYISFKNLNKIEKYDPGGNILYRADRLLNYEIVVPKIKTIASPNGTKATVYSLFPTKEETMLLVSNGIAADNSGRAWVVTAPRQSNSDEDIDMFELEIYDTNGILLGKIPLIHYVDNIRIYNDRLYLIDKMLGMNVLEYRIIEK